MNIHLPAILMFTRGTRFWPINISKYMIYFMVEKKPMKLMDDNMITMYFDIFFQKEVAFIKLDNYRGTKKSSESSSSIHARFMCQWCRRCRRRLKCHRSSTKTRQTRASKCGTTSPEHLLDWIPYNMYIYIYIIYIYTHVYIYIYLYKSGSSMEYNHTMVGLHWCGKPNNIKPISIIMH